MKSPGAMKLVYLAVGHLAVKKKTSVDFYKIWLCWHKCDNTARSKKYETVL